MKKHEECCENNTTWKIISGVLALVVIALLLNGFGKTAATGQQAQQQQQATANVDMTVFSDDVVKGPADAKVTIILYSDPSCPYCAAAAGGSEMVAYMQSRSAGYEPAVPGILKNYVDTGKARLVFRYFPGHGKGQDAMKIMWCANEQNKFWSIHDVMFNNQKLMEAGDAAGLKSLAVKAGVDSAKLDTCLASGKYDSRFDKEAQMGAGSGVQGTPGFFVNGVAVSGAVPFETIKQTIDAALA